MKIPWQALRFLVTGTFNTAMSYAVYAVALYAGCGYALANLLACIGGILIGFRTHGAFVFTDSSAPKLWRFVLVWGALYGVNVLLIRLFIEAGLNAYWAGAVAMPFIIVASYGFNRFLVFKKDVPPAASPPPA
jgi:putative flippase GtrA